MHFHYSFISRHEIILLQNKNPLQYILSQRVMKSMAPPRGAENIKHFRHFLASLGRLRPVGLSTSSDIASSVARTCGSRCPVRTHRCIRLRRVLSLLRKFWQKNGTHFWVPKFTPRIGRISKLVYEGRGRGSM